MNIINTYIGLRTGMIDSKLAELERDYFFQDFLLKNGKYSQTVIDRELAIEKKMNSLRNKKSKLIDKIKK